MRTKIKALIVSVHGTTSTHSQSGSIYLQKITVKELPELNPFGKDYSKIIPFTVEIHNNNIEGFGVKQQNEGEICELDLLGHPIKVTDTENLHKFIVNNLSFVI